MGGIKAITANGLHVGESGESNVELTEPASFALLYTIPYIFQYILFFIPAVLRTVLFIYGP